MLCCFDDDSGKIINSQLVAGWSACCCHGSSIRRHGCGGVVEALVKPWGNLAELAEEAEVRVLHGLAGVNPQFIAQQDSEALIRRERLGHIAPRRKCAHQQQMC